MPGLLGSAAKPSSLAKGVGTQSGYPVTPLHSGSRFTGHQQSKGNKYHVEVEFKVGTRYICIASNGMACTMCIICSMWIQRTLPYAAT